MSGGQRSARALRVAGPERIEFFQQQLPVPRDDQVLVAVRACGVCGSDLRFYRQGSRDYPYFGHEFSGKVLAAGSAVPDLAVGDRVASGLLRGCGACSACRMGFPNFCMCARSPFSPGGFAELCLVTCAASSRFLTKIPAELDDVRATLHEPLSCAMRIHARAGDGGRILVLGLGMMGMLAGLLFKHSSPQARVVGADTHAGRVALGCGLGLDSCIQLGSIVPEFIPDENADFDIVVDATGVAAVFPLALRMARIGGTVILGGVPESIVPFSPVPIFRKELTIKGAKGPFPFPDEAGDSRVIDLLLSKYLPWDSLVDVFPIEKVDEAFRRASDGSSLKSVLIWPTA